MKFSLVVLSALALLVGQAHAECEPMMEVMLDGEMKLAMSGFEPTVMRFPDSDMDKIVLKDYTRKPMVEMMDGKVIVSAGDVCDAAPSPAPPPTTDSAAAGIGLGLLTGKALGATTATVAVTAAGMLQALPAAYAQDDDCEISPVTVEIYTSAPANEMVMRMAQSGDFETCPPESLYWKHHPKVFGGYEGCVGEKGYYPCPQDSQGIWEEGGDLYAKYPLNWDGESCVETGYTTETRTYWILWGDPLDKYELNMRTGFNPVVSFPFNRGPYPRYEQGEALDTAVDDSSDARAMAKEFLAYLGAFTMEELEDWDVTMTEGAESGMTAIWAAKALDIARTTCNRDMYALMEVPAYGYSPSNAAALANKFSSSFYAGEECLCFNTTTCNDPTITISNRGWLPTTPFPVEMGGDGMMYAANSTSDASPWFESMVFPENPSGKIKESQLANANRRVCDGVYVWPMYFGMRDFMIPMDERPDCASWSFSITKAYSASVRAGFVLYKKNPMGNHESMADITGDLYSMTNGLYSEWSWYGQMQLWEMIMSRPLSDPTSWIGAYSEIMKEKWDLVIDGFKDCPVTTLTNDYSGAYAWFVYNEDYTGIQDGFVASFFRDVLGIRTTTYNWGFRGANPADFYGPTYTTADFTRLQLYRDVSVYEEVSRRAKLVCSDMDAMVGDFMSVNQWAMAARRTKTRRLEQGYADLEDRKRHLKEVVPDLTERQLEYVAQSHADSDVIDRQAASCAPEYTTQCLMDAVGNRFSDF